MSALFGRRGGVLSLDGEVDNDASLFGDVDLVNSKAVSQLDVRDPKGLGRGVDECRLEPVHLRCLNGQIPLETVLPPLVDVLSVTDVNLTDAQPIQIEHAVCGKEPQPQDGVSRLDESGGRNGRGQDDDDLDGNSLI